MFFPALKRLRILLVQSLRFLPEIIGENYMLFWASFSGVRVYIVFSLKLSFWGESLKIGGKIKVKRDGRFNVCERNIVDCLNESKNQLEK